jgi:hypothetical protein
MDCQTLWPLDATIRVQDCGGHADVLGDGPHEGRQCSGAGDHHLMRMFAAGPELPVPLTQADLRLPTDVLEAFREVFQAAWQRAAPVGRIALRPSAFAQGPAGLRVAGFREAALATPFTTGVGRRRQAQVTHERAGGIKPGQLAPCGDEGDGHGALYAPQGLAGLDHRGQTPSVHLLVEGLFQTLEAVGVFGDGPHVCREDAWLGWRRTDHFREPPEVSRAPRDLARMAHILPEEQGFEPSLRRLAVATGLVTGATQVTTGVVFDLWDIDRGQIS